MANELTLIEFERQLKPMHGQFQDVLADRMPVERLTRTVLMACEKTPKLLRCNRQSLLNAAMTFAVLALETDGVTGQGYIIPFADVAQPVIGYKGYNTIGARSGITITGEVVREGDAFDWDEGEGWVKFKQDLKGGGRIVAAWAKAAALNRPAIVKVLGLNDLEAIRLRAPARDKRDSPWNDPTIGLPAMYSKSVKRRLARSTPMEWARPEFHYAARMEEAFEEQGRHAYISPDKGVVIEGASSPIAEREPSETPTLDELRGPKPDPELEALKREGLEAAHGGTEVVSIWWDRRLTSRQRAALETWKEQELKPVAVKADKEEAI